MKLIRKSEHYSINVIIGPPCAGKSTHVQATKKDGDVVVDADAIARAIGSTTPHGRAEPIRGLALRLRHSLIERVLSDVAADAWIIHTSPSRALLERYQKAGAKFQVLDPGIDVCLARVASDARPDGTEEAIRQWYESPPDMSDLDTAKGGGAVYLIRASESGH